MFLGCRTCAPRTKHCFKHLFLLAVKRDILGRTKMSIPNAIYLNVGIALGGAVSFYVFVVILLDDTR